MDRGWNFGMSVQGTPLRAVASNVLSVRVINSLYYAISVIYWNSAIDNVCDLVKLNDWQCEQQDLKNTNCGERKRRKKKKKKSGYCREMNSLLTHYLYATLKNKTNQKTARLWLNCLKQQWWDLGKGYRGQWHWLPFWCPQPVTDVPAHRPW